MMRFLKRFYICSIRLLPFAFIIFTACNFYLLLSRQKLDADRLKSNILAFENYVSNRSAYVENFISNQISRAKAQFRFMRLDYDKLSFAPQTNSVLTKTEKPVEFPQIPENLVARYFISNSKPFVSIDGFCYTIGDDFGLGEIVAIYPRFLDTVYKRYNLIREPSYSLPLASIKQETQND